ncbi:AMP-binding protein [Thalassospira marina]|uniref:AMP-dependent synthetase/ligase domain-containing protein n=1 Tax=Thalassospira marina TaxID=2048283 RepID=A0ABN5FHY3_9PROT|nr:AMP-binding protein [Thalassospira marina]AUG53594.1 hypothetical protein CSC3H3_13380 [Thalassospira marina]
MNGFLAGLLMPQSPDPIICFEDDAALDRARMATDIAHIASHIKHSQTQAIAIHCQSARLFAVALAATWLARATAVLPASDRTGYLDEIASAFDLFLDDAAITATLGAHETSNQPVWQETDLPAPENCLATFYTSGSTGAPKAIAKTLAQLEAEMAMQTPLWQSDLRANCRIWGLVSHQHIYGLLFRVIWPVMTDVPFISAQARFWEDIVPNLRDGDIIIASPAHLQRLHPDLVNAARPARIFCSGGPLDHKSAMQAHAALGIWPTEILGSTETGGIAWRQQTSGDTPWQPLPDVRTSQNDEGCLMVAAPHIDGENWHHTADRVAFDNRSGTSRFRLLGRADRVIKIEGKRISLDRVETHLRNHNWVDEAVALLPDDTDNRLAAIVVLSLRGCEYLREHGAFHTGRILRNHIGQHEDDAALPRRWRFVDAIPTDSQGKKPLHLLRALFTPPAKQPKATAPMQGQPPITAPVTFPTILERSQENDLARLTLRMDPELLYFQGHFDGAPVLPGVVQLHWAVHYARDAFDIVITPDEITQLKYRKVITPNDQIILQLECDRTRGQVRFTYLGPDTDYSSGLIKFTKAS